MSPLSASLPPSLTAASISSAPSQPPTGPLLPSMRRPASEERERECVADWLTYCRLLLLLCGGDDPLVLLVDVGRQVGAVVTAVADTTTPPQARQLLLAPPLQPLGPTSLPTYLSPMT